MSSDPVYAALNPGNKLKSLSTFAPNLLAVRETFTKLLVWPHLESMNVTSDKDKSAENFLQLVNDGNARLNSLTLINIGLARNVSGYNSAFGVLLDQLEIATFVLTMQPIAKDYADKARDQFEANKTFFEGFAKYIENVNQRIADMDSKLADLDKQIEESSQALAGQNIVTMLWNILKELYKLATNPSEADVQIASLLGVTVTDIVGNFATLYQERERLQKVLKSLRDLRNQVSSLKTTFVTLSGGLKKVTTESSALLDVWDDVADRMNAVADDTSLVKPAVAQELIKAWNKVQQDADAYIKAVSDGGNTGRTFLAKEHRAAFDALPHMPITPAEIALARLALSRPPSYSPPSAAPPSYKAASAASGSDEDIVKQVLNPPNDAKKQLDDLADDTGKIIDQFDTLLQQPFVEQLEVTDPTDPNGEKKTTIYAMVSHYRAQYLQLQLDTLPVARTLKAFSELQIALLPLVQAGDGVEPPDISMETFLGTNTPVVAEYKAKADDLATRNTQMKLDWDNAVNAVQKAINECTENIEKWQKSVDQMTEEQKKAKLFGALLAVGAFLVFALSAFLPGGILAGLGAAGALGGMAIDQLIKANKLTQAINELKGAIENARQTRTKLQNLMPFLLAIAESLSNVSQIWQDIAKNMTTVDTFYKVLNGPTGPQVLNNLKPTIIANWEKVGKSCDDYIAAVSRRKDGKSSS